MSQHRSRMDIMKHCFALLGLCVLTSLATGSTALAQGQVDADPVAGISLPQTDVVRGKALFAARGCVVCHSVNNVGGNSGPSLDASNLDQSRNPFDFFARMWRGADQMLHLQSADLGYQIDFDGQDLADIYAFVQNGEAQEGFTEDDLTDRIREIIDNGPSVGHN